jgi:hypothetical protein
MVLTRSVYQVTSLNTLCVSFSITCLSSKSTLSMFLFIIPPIMPQSFSDTRATTLYCMDPDITANQAHLPVPIICVDFACGQSWRYYNNQQNSMTLSCCCCCCCVSNCQVYSWAVMSFTITMLQRVCGKPRMCSRISSPVLSTHPVANVQTIACTG